MLNSGTLIAMKWNRCGSSTSTVATPTAVSAGHSFALPVAALVTNFSIEHCGTVFGLPIKPAGHLMLRSFVDPAGYTFGFSLSAFVSASSLSSKTFVC